MGGAVAKGILERLAEGPVLGDGGYLLELEKRGYVQAGSFTPEVVLEHPDALAQAPPSSCAPAPKCSRR